MTILCNQFIGKSELTEQDFAQMYQLMDSYYENFNPKEFLRLLAMKDFIFLVKDDNESIQAVTTVQLIELSDGLETMQGILLGDPITQKDYSLKENILEQAIEEYRKHQTEKKKEYVFITCKNFKTYHQFHELFYHSYPCFNENTPYAIKHVMKMFGEFYSSQNYDTLTGLIKHESRPVVIKEPAGMPEEEHKQSEEEVFFLHKNPKWKKGYELVCSAEFTDENWIHNVF